MSGTTLPDRPPVVLLAGGLGTRLAEKTEAVPKPMVQIGGRPILWHIMKHYAHFGFREFFVALGYRGEAIKQYFLEYRNLSGDLTLDLTTGSLVSSAPGVEDWLVHLIDTGLGTNTGGRVRRLSSLLPDGPFLLTYGDGLADIDIDSLFCFHRDFGAEVTVTAVRSPARFGEMTLHNDAVEEFSEKRADGGWINGGFMVLERSVFDYLDDDEAVLEHALERLAKDGKLTAYRHSGFWQCMDTLRDQRYLESLWQAGAPWKLW